MKLLFMDSIDMLPVTVFNNGGDSRLAYAVFEAKALTCFPCGVAASDFPDLIFCKLSVALPSPPLLNHVHAVVFHCPQKQMFRVHTRRIVTMVADKNPIGDRTAMNLPRDPVGQYGPGLINPDLNLDSAVSVNIGSGYPFPAIPLWAVAGSLINLFPESLREWPSWVRAMWPVLSRGQVKAFPRAVNTLCGPMGEENRLTEQADAWYRCNSQGRNLHRLGFVLVRLVRGLTTTFEPFAF